MQLIKTVLVKSPFRISSSPQDKPVDGTTYSNPLIIIPKGDTIECVLDARHLNSNTEQSDESWPIEHLAPHLARAKKKYKSAIDLLYAYEHTPLDENTIKPVSPQVTNSLLPKRFSWSQRSPKFLYKTNVYLL